MSTDLMYSRKCMSRFSTQLTVFEKCHNLSQSGEVTMADSTAFAAKQMQLEPLPGRYVEAESAFYKDYAWCLDAVPTVGEIVQHLRQEFDRFGSLDERWHRTAVA